MAHLRSGEVAVDRDSNLSTTGPSGTRKRKATSCYLLVGGSSNTYKVTISTEGAHFCVDYAGSPCKGNTHGKARKYGPVNVRNTQNPAEWCKHVAGAMASPEMIAEAQDITASAFGATPARKPEPKPERIVRVTVTGDARKRLAELEAEAEALRSTVVREAVAALISEHGREAVAEAIKAA